MACVLILGGVGNIFQAIATRSDIEKYPAPGKLIDMGGYRLHLHCMGVGSPTVILDAAADMMSADWGWIQPEVAAVTRVCAYDRAGMGWSDSGPYPRDAHEISVELHALLTRSGVTGSYVLVGHSAGALYARVFAAQHPDDVVGMVLIDPGHPDMPDRIPSLQAQMRKDARLTEMMRLLCYVGVPRLLGIGGANAQGLPPQQAAEVSASTVTPRHWATICALIAATPASYEQARSARISGTRPLVVISANTAWSGSGAVADETRRRVNQLHAELAAFSTNSRHCIVEEATHASLVHDRRQARTAIAAIRAVLTAARTGQPLSL